MRGVRANVGVCTGAVVALLSGPLGVGAPGGPSAQDAQALVTDQIRWGLCTSSCAKAVSWLRLMTPVRVPAGTFEMGCVADDRECRQYEVPRHTVTLTRPYERVRVPAGTFEMGCVADDRECRQYEVPRHTVTLTRPYELMATEVTVGQFRAHGRAVGQRIPRQPSWNRADDRPLVNVTWTEMRDFCWWAGGRLPTEAEWERAARAGQDGLIYPWGPASDLAPVNALGQGENDTWRWTAPVGSYPPNAYGLYDMTGNVWEWVADWFWNRYYANSPPLDPAWLREGRARVVRGGSWDSGPPNLRLSFRSRLSPTGRHGLYVGGRCARDVARPAS